MILSYYFVSVYISISYPLIMEKWPPSEDRCVFWYLIISPSTQHRAQHPLSPAPLSNVGMSSLPLGCRVTSLAGQLCLSKSHPHSTATSSLARCFPVPLHMPTCTSSPISCHTHWLRIQLSKVQFQNFVFWTLLSFLILDPSGFHCWPLS